MRAWNFDTRGLGLLDVTRSISVSHRDAGNNLMGSRSCQDMIESFVKRKLCGKDLLGEYEDVL